jgi:DNA-binding NarL/FixJ family response regulator
VRLGGLPYNRHRRKVLHVPMSEDPRPTTLVRVLLADDHRPYAETLEMLLELDDRIEVVGRAGSGAEAIELAVALQPDAILMDVHMPCVDGIKATRTVKALLPRVQVVMLSSSPAVEDVERSRDAGASGYLTKDAAGTAITAELARVCSSTAGDPSTGLCAA